MNNAIETIEHNGYTISLYQDEDCSSPRDNDWNFLFLGLPHRHYNIGDETIDVSDFKLPCTSGLVYHEDCTECYGDGERVPSNLSELCDAIQAHYKARVCLPVGMIDHSGVSYYIGGGAHWSDSAGWDSGTCGFILDTPDIIRERYGDADLGYIQDLTDDMLVSAMTAEIAEYSSWAEGDCYGYVIEDVNGETVDSCWGFIGYEYAKREALDACPDTPVEPLIPVRMTRAQWETTLTALDIRRMVHPITSNDPTESMAIIQEALK